jgi:hypothetical protein
MRTTLFSVKVILGMMLTPVYADDAPYAELEGIEARCARDVANATWEVMRDQSWRQLSQLLSFGGASDMVALIGDTIRAELRGCFVEVYRLGVEHGQRIEASHETPR